MRAAFKFSKGGAARYIAHLDLMRAMNRAIRRAGLPAQYSQGFHPHIVMSFAQALGLGYLSEGEYMEISLPDGANIQDAMESLNRALPDGLLMTGAWAIPEGMATLMAQVTAARWRVEFAEPLSGEDIKQCMSLLDRETIDVVKDGKNGPAAMEIRKGIYSIEAKNGSLELFLAAGSALNIRPELVVKAAFGGTVQALSITRLELYATGKERQMPFYQIFNDGDLYDCGKNNPC